MQRLFVCCLKDLLDFILLAALSSLCFAQSTTRSSLLVQPVDESSLTVLQGNTHPLALQKYDQGPAPATLALNRMLLVLKRNDAQESALRQLLDDQQDKSSPSYHKWLTPLQFGQQFGPTDQDLQAVTRWLQSHGFTINRVSNGRNTIEFSGNAGQVQQAFHTTIHHYVVNNEDHWANASDPQIPTALAPAVAGIDSLHNFPKQPLNRFIGTYSKTSGKLLPANPQFTFPGGCDQDNNCYALVPYDFAIIYDVLPLWTAGIDGTGESIAIVGRTNINVQDVRDFRNLFGLPANDPQIILNGPDPGINGDESEADIDVQWSGAVARNATIQFVTSASTETTDGIDLSAEYIIDNNLAPVMSESYGICELGAGTAGNQFFSGLWEQAAAQGITVMVSSGDSGAAGCDFFQGFAPQPAANGLAVNAIASTPFNVAVGGTDFNDVFNPQTYWNTFNDPTTQASAKGYIPELTWDDTCTNVLFAQIGFSSNAETNCNDSRLRGFVFTIGAGGGVSNCTVNNQQLGTCSGGYAKPSWQTGTGVPSDGKRDLPDVSLFASDGFLGNFYIICQSDLAGPCTLNTFAGFGGTSVASPAFAGIMSLVNQQTGTRQGNANYVLYKLAAQKPNSFHDVNTGTIAMPCAKGSPNCTIKTNGHQFGVLSGYGTTAGYDLATGLGSVDAASLVNNWSSVIFTPTTTTLALTPNVGITHGQAVTVNIGVSPSAATGDVSLLTSTEKGVDRFTLSGGSFSGTTSLLPGGTYTVTAHYAGDATHGASDSVPVSVTVTKENSKTVARLITFDSSGRIVNPNASSAVYGSPYLLRVDVTNSAGAVCVSVGCPTGNVALTDNGSVLDGGTFVLNSLGYTEDQIIQLPGGVNAVQAQYQGDNSFNASTGNDSVTITPASTSVTTPNSGGVYVGGTLIRTVTVQTQSSGIAPSGTVILLANGSPLAGNATYTPTNGSPSAPASLTAQITSSLNAPGTYTITAQYSGDANYSASTSGGISVVALYPGPAMTVTPVTQTIPAGSSATLVALLDTGLKGVPVPTGPIVFSLGGGLHVTGTETYANVTDSNGNVAVQDTLTFTPAVSLLVTPTWSGDSNYAPSSNFGQATIIVTGNDFNLSPVATSLTVTPPGGQNGMTIFVGGQSGYNGTINFTPSSCSGLPAESTCSFVPPSVTGAGFTNVYISTTAPHSAAANAIRPTLTSPWLAGGLGVTFAGIFLAGLPSKKRRSGTLLSMLAVVFLLYSGGCGGGGSSGGPSPFKDPGTPKGSYSITVTATSGNLTHTANFTLVVQ